MERLAAAILIQTVKDLKNPKEHKKIYDFLKSEWFETLVISVGLDPFKTRKQIMTGNYNHVNIHAVYR